MTSWLRGGDGGPVLDLQLRNLRLRNRIVMAPMCQYAVTSRDGQPNDWHYVHYSSRAVGGAGLITFEMTDIEPAGRITENCLGIWSDDHISTFARIVESCQGHGAKVSLQIAHAGRKAEHVDEPVAPSAIRFPDPKYKQPRALTIAEIERIVEAFALAARRAMRAGFDVIEVHAAHGYLIHQFQSRLTNHRTDRYGEDRARFGSEVIAAVKAEIGARIPLAVRISAIEYADGGYDIDWAIALCRRYRQAGVDLFSISSGGESAFPADFPGHHVPFAKRIKAALAMPVIVSGRLDDPGLADSVIAIDDVDLVAVGRGMLKDPYWALHAAQSLARTIEIPGPYTRAF